MSANGLYHRIQRAIRDSIRKATSRNILRAGSLSITGQSMISGANFVFMVVAARQLGPAAFGLFALLYSALALAEAVQAALVTTPHTVISGSKHGEEYRRYTSSVAVLQFALALVTALIIAVAGAIAWFFDPSIAVMLFLLAFASVGWLSQSFVRKVLFTRSQFGTALVNDVVTHGGRLLLLAGLLTSARLTEQSLFLILGVALLCGSVLGFWQIRESLTFAFDRGVIREHWQFGNWLGASKVAEMMPNYITAAVLSTTLSIGAYGAYRAARQLMNASHVPLRALDSLLRPRLAREAQHGPEAVTRIVLPIMMLGGIVFLAFAAFVIFLREPLIETIFGAEYRPYAVVIVLLAFRPLMELQSQVLTNALLAFRKTRAIFIRTLLGALVGSALGTAAVITFGAPAAGAIPLFGAVVSVMWLGWAWRRHLKEHNQDVGEAQVGPEQLASR